MTLSRREALKHIAVVSTLAAVPSVFAASPASSKKKADLPSLGHSPYSLPDLPYPVEALEPFIDRQTMEIHHGKHHAGYVKKLNAALKSEAAWGKQPLEVLLQSIHTLPESLQGAVRKHGGGHYNHSLFWTSLSPVSKSPDPSLARALSRDFGSVNDALQALKKEALSVFGSGWAWFVVSPFGRVSVERSINQENPVMEKQIPLLGIDVWEHAYYLKYQNRRADYLDAIFQILDWTTLSERYQAVRGA